VERRQATPGHMQPRKPQVNAAQGHVQPYLATGGVCMACGFGIASQGARALSTARHGAKLGDADTTVTLGDSDHSLRKRRRRSRSG